MVYKLFKNQHMLKFARLGLTKIMLPQIQERPDNHLIDLWANEVGNVAKGAAFLHNMNYVDQEQEINPYFHDFSWLRDFFKIGGNSSKKQSLHLTRQWLQKYPKYHPKIWKKDLLCQRIINWLIYFDLIWDHNDSLYQRKLFSCFNEHVYYIFRQQKEGFGDVANFLTLEALIAVSCCFQSYEKYLRKFLLLLQEEIEQQIYQDGSHYSRNPLYQYQILRILLEIRAFLYAVDRDIPSFLSDTIQHMVEILTLLRHADGRLCIFHGSHEGDQAHINQVIRQVHCQSRSPNTLTEMGLLRAQRKQMLLFVDCADSEFSEEESNYISPLSFELSIGRTRVITNCGAPVVYDPVWQEALHSSAAHSTVTIGNVSPKIPYNIKYHQEEKDGFFLFDATHDGYKSAFQIYHRRVLCMDPKGTTLMGEDYLENIQDHDFDIRFHLHPLIRCSKLPKRNQVLLLFPDGSGWRFMTSFPQISLQESVYFGHDGKRKRTEQIVISGNKNDLNYERCIKWTLKNIM